MWVPPFHCSYHVCITNELSFLCSIVQIFRRWGDGVYIKPKGSRFMDARLLTIPRKMRLGIVWWTVDFASMDLCLRLYCKATFIFMLITLNNACSNHLMNASVVSLNISIYPWWINNIIFHGYVEIINKKVGEICWVTIFINSHTFAWVFFII